VSRGCSQEIELGARSETSLLLVIPLTTTNTKYKLRAGGGGFHILLQPPTTE
jgi:hypothetical protein